MLRISRLLLCAVATLWIADVQAAEKLRVGKAVPFAWTFTPIEVGIQTGIFAKHGVELDVSAFGDRPKPNIESR